MNLKIEAKCQNQQFSHSSNGSTSSAPNTTYSSSSINGERPPKQSGQQQTRSDLELLGGHAAPGEHLTTINSAQCHQQHQHQLIEVFQRTGSPDDDDYRHNYPETHSIPHSSMQQQQQQQQVINISGQHPIPSASFMQTKQHLSNEPATMSSSIMQADTNCLTNLTHQHHQSTVSQFGHPMSAQVCPLSSVDPSPEHNHYLGHMGGGSSQVMVESCQSPYNSPAPTPYSSFAAPQLHTDIRDYYSSDCIRYG